MTNKNEELSGTLLTSEEEVDSRHRTKGSSNRNTAILAVVVIVVLAVIVLVAILSRTLNTGVVPPTAIKMPLLGNTTTMKLGTSRVLDLLFFSGNDDRTSLDFQSVTEQSVHWRTFPEGIVSVDPYGRVEALAIGKTTIKVMSVYDVSVSDSKTIEVVANQKKISTNKRVVNFVGPTRKIPQNYQKLIDRYSKEQVAGSATVPKSIKEVSADPDSPSKKVKIEVGSVTWEIMNYQDKSDRTYLKRTDSAAA
jgi:hypothetical protein